MHLSSASGRLLRRRRSRPVLNVWVVLVVLGVVAAPTMLLGAPSLSVQPETATVGDPITLTITVPEADASTITWPTLEGNRVGDLTLLHADTVLRGKAYKRLGGPSLVLTTAAYDTGTFSTGDLQVSVGGLPHTLPAQQVTIVSVLGDSTGNQLRPLKAQEDLPITFSDLVRWFGPWIALAGVLLILWEVIRRLLRKRRQRQFEEEEGIPLLSPYEEALQALAALEKENPLAHGDQKGYVSALGQITKRLLQRTHLTPVLEMTTYEVRRWLIEKSTLCDPADLLKILEAGDHVKFARGSLNAENAGDLLSAAKRIVAAYEPRELPEENNETNGPDDSDSHGNVRPTETDGETVPVEESAGSETEPEWRMHTAKTGANRARRPQ